MKMPVWENDNLSRDEAIRIAALIAAAESRENSNPTSVILTAQQYEKYIRTGERR